MEFIKSLVSPLRMKKYSNMSVFISILIFVVTIYILMFSYRIKTNSQKEKLIADNTLELLGLYELEDPNFDYSKIQDYGYVIKDKKLTTTSDNQEVKSYQVTYTKDGVTRVVNIVFDPYDIREKNIQTFKEQYYEKYNITDPNKTDQNKAYYISNMVYAKSKGNPEFDASEYMETLQNKTLKELEDEALTFTVFDLFQIEQVDNAVDYIIAFNPSYLVYGVEANNENKQIAATVYYVEKMEINFANFNSISEFSITTSRAVIDIYIKTMQDKQNLNYFLSILLMPFFLVLIIWFFYRRNSVIKKYKEFYNIAAISSIIPTILVFIVSWFWLNVYIIHAALMLVYYVYVLYRINSNPNID